jgi:hypothetical protein
MSVVARLGVCMGMLRNVWADRSRSPATEFASIGKKVTRREITSIIDGTLR